MLRRSVPLSSAAGPLPDMQLAYQDKERLRCSYASVRHTDACHSQGAQGTDREPPKLAHVRQPMTEVISPAWGFLARSKRGTRPMQAWVFGGTRQRRKKNTVLRIRMGRDQGRGRCLVALA